MKSRILYIAATLLLAGTALAETAAEGHHGEAHLNWWGFDSHAPAIGWFIVDFLIFLGLMYWKAWGPIQQFFLKRHGAVKVAIEEARQAKEEAERVYKEYSDRLARLDAEVDQLIAEFEQEGKLEQARIVAAAERAAGKVMRDAEITIEQELLRHKRELRNETVAAAMGVAEKLLTEKLTDDDRRRFTTEYLQSLDTLSAQAKQRAA